MQQLSQLPNNWRTPCRKKWWRTKSCMLIHYY